MKAVECFIVTVTDTVVIHKRTAKIMTQSLFCSFIFF